MPSPHTARLDVKNSFYHVFARGASKQKIFLDDADFNFFISLFKRYLSAEQAYRKFGEPYPNLSKNINLLSYCLMQNHFHLYIYQIEEGSLSQLMQGIMTSYSRYFNTKYKRTGSLYENRYKAVKIDNDSHHIHISRYIHMNPRYWLYYRYSSLPYYTARREADWLNTGLVMKNFRNNKDYLLFLNDYRYRKSQLEEIKPYLSGW